MGEGQQSVPCPKLLQSKGKILHALATRLQEPHNWSKTQHQIEKPPFFLIEPQFSSQPDQSLAITLFQLIQADNI
jgi:hypothetical protein